MGQLLHLAFADVTQDDVLRAWAAHRALVLAEAMDPRLLKDSAHQAASREAQDKYRRLYSEWVGQ